MNLFFAKTAFAQTTGTIDLKTAATPLVMNIVTVIVQPIVLALFLVAVGVFAWGIFGLIMNADDPSARKVGQDHIIWGVIGIVIMLSAYGIIRVVASSVGAPDPFL